MDRPRWGLRILLGCLFAGFACGQAAAQTYDQGRAQYRPRTRVYGPYQAAPQSQSRFVAVMGAVGNAGVFEVEASRVTLTSVIARAGGLLDNALQTVRVVRDGRVAFQSFLTDRSTVQVNAGDIVVVDRRRQRTVNQGQRSFAGANSKQKQNTGVEIAILNLLDRPVVMRIREEHATVSAIVSLLGQNATAAQRARLVNVSRSRQSAESTRLSSGTILLLDAGTVRRERIPALPKPHLLREDPDAARSRPASPSRQDDERYRPTKYRRSSESRIIQTGAIETSEPPRYADGNVPPTAQLHHFKKQGVRNLLVSARRDIAAGRLTDAVRKARHAQLAEVEFELLEDRPELVLAAAEKAAQSGGQAADDSETRTANVPPLQGPSVSANVATSLSSRANIPTRANETPGSPGILNSSAPELPQPRRILESRPPTTVAETSSTSSLPTLNDMRQADLAELDSLMTQPVGETEASPAVVDESSWFSVRSVVAVIVVLAIFAVSWLLLSMGRRSTPEQGTSPIATNSTVLDRLIRNELPIREEAPPFPASLEIGIDTSAAARVEPVQQLSPRPPQSVRQPARQPVQPVRVQPAEDVLRPHFQPRVVEDTPRPAATVEPRTPAPQAAVVAKEPPQPLPVAAPAAVVAPATATEVNTHNRHSVSPPNRRTMSRLNSSDALGRALSALRETSTLEG